MWSTSEWGGRLYSKSHFMKYDDKSVKINELNIELITFSFLSLTLRPSRNFRSLLAVLLTHKNVSNFITQFFFLAFSFSQIYT